MRRHQIEHLELRRLLCIEHVGDDVPETHLFGADGRHLELHIPDPSAVDVATPSAPSLFSAAAAPKGSLVLPAMGPEIEIAAATPAPVGNLSGKIAYMNAGHGWTWGTTTWNTQRPEYQDIVEDFQTQDQMTFYANYMLNAGATVVATRPIGHQLKEVIVDNHDAGFSIVSGSWSTNAASSTYWSNVSGTDTTDRYRFAVPSATETAVARWTPNLTEAGFYPVYAWWSNGVNRSTEVTYRINAAGGSQEVKVNQRYTGKGWVYLGSYYFLAGSGGNVEISNKSPNGAAIIADAIRFGNGMGDVHGQNNAANPISGKPREEELSLYWLYRSRGYTGSNAIVDQSTIDGTSTTDANRGIGGPPRWISYMNDETQGANTDRLHLSFHSNGSTGLPNATARGTEGLLNNTVANRTVNQQWWANAVGEEIEEDMEALPAGMLEHAWFPRNNVYSSSNYGEINENNLDAFNSLDHDTTSELCATILEVAFHDNLQDSQNMRNPKVRDWVARAAYQAAVKYFATWGGITQTFLPDPPTATRATTNAAGDVTINWTAPGTGAANGGAGAATGYKIYIGDNGYTWKDVVTLANVTSHTFALGTLPAGMNYFKVVATNAGGESMQRDVVVAKPQDSRRAAILIVNGFDRLDRTGDDTQSHAGGSVDRVRYRYQNTRDFVAQVGEAIEAFNPDLGVETAQNEQVISGAVNLTDFHTVIWISGEENSIDSTFDATERTKITAFLSAGGKLFVSGSEIAAELDNGGVDPIFYNSVLRADFVNNDAGTYTTNGAASSIFAGLSGIAFDNGAETTGSFITYDVDQPDVINPINGSTAALTYSGGIGGTAAVQYSSGSTRLVHMGFPFETIVDAAKRDQVMSAMLTFFDVNSTVDISPPSATLGTETPTPGSSTFDFTVTYADATGVNTATFDSSDVTVTGPGGFNQNASFVSNVGGVATYRINAPGGTWNFGDNGTYTVSQNAAQIADLDGNARPAGTIGPINVAVPYAWVFGSVLHVENGSSTLARSGSNLFVFQPTPISFPLASFTSILIEGRNAADIVSFAGAITQPVTFIGGGGTDLLKMNSGSANLASDVGAGGQSVDVIVNPTGTLTFSSSQHLNQLQVIGNATVTAGGNKVVVTKSLDVTGKLDLADNDLVWNYEGSSPLGTFTAGAYTGAMGLVASGRNGGAWNGNGIITTKSDAVAPQHKTTIAVAEASDLPGISPFAGESLDGTAILFKYTYAGDADLNGVINGDDFFDIDNSFPNSGNVFGQTDGDFDLNGSIDSDDYFLIDANYGKGQVPI